MKRLTIVVDTYSPMKDGVLTYLRGIIPLLKERYDITLVAPKFPGRREEFFEGIETILTPNIPVELASYRPAIPSWGLTRAVRKADVVLVNDLAPLGATALLVAHALGKPIALFCHHDESLMLTEAFKLQNKRFIPKKRFCSVVDKIVFRYYRCADVIFVATDKFHRKLKRLKIPDEKIIFAPFAIDLGKFSPADGRAAKKKYGIPEDAKVVLYLGRMSHEKNVETIIRSIPIVSSSMGSVYYVFAGGGAKLEEYRALARRIAPHSNVLFTGWVEWEATPEIYSMADVFAFPSLHESQAFATMEAMASSIAVIAPRDDESRYSYYEENKNCIFLDNPKDPGALAEKILMVFKDGELRKRLGSNARKKMEEYSWENHVAKLELGFEQVKKAQERKEPIKVSWVIFNRYSLLIALLILIWHAKNFHY